MKYQVEKLQDYNNFLNPVEIWEPTQLLIGRTRQ